VVNSTNKLKNAYGVTAKLVLLKKKGRDPPVHPPIIK